MITLCVSVSVGVTFNLNTYIYVSAFANYPIVKSPTDVLTHGSSRRGVSTTTPLKFYWNCASKSKKSAALNRIEQQHFS